MSTTAKEREAKQFADAATKNLVRNALFYRCMREGSSVWEYMSAESDSRREAEKWLRSHYSQCERISVNDLRECLRQGMLAGVLDPTEDPIGWWRVEMLDERFGLSGSN